MREYVEKCTRNRMRATTKAEQNLWKTSLNSVYGKLIENMTKRMDCRFNKREGQALRNASSPLFKGMMICSEDFSISFHEKKELVMKQNWAVGFTVLELSKLVMQQHFYDHIQPVFGIGNIGVVMSDTDSFLFAANISCSEWALKQLDDVMDFSNFPKDHPLFSNERKKVPGYLKSEVGAGQIVEAVALKPKTYCFVTDSGKVEKKAKAVTEAGKRLIPFDHYLSCLQSMKVVNVKQRYITAKNHINKVMESTKVAFSSFDDKRYPLCPIHSVPYGSKYIDILEDGECFFCKYASKLY